MKIFLDTKPLWTVPIMFRGFATVSGYARNARWRDRNRDQYNANQREIMRRKRAKAKGIMTS